MSLNEKSDLQALKKAFKEDRDQVMGDIYKLYRMPFIAFSQRFTQDNELAIESFQEAVISLYENLTHDKITRNESSLKTYLFSIGKHKLLSAINKENNKLNTTGENVNALEESTSSDNQELKEVLSLAFDQLGEQCRKVLMRFYYDRYSIESIMIEMDYKNENTVKAHKSRCLSKLRAVFKKQNK